MTSTRSVTHHLEVVTCSIVTRNDSGSHDGSYPSLVFLSNLHYNSPHVRCQSWVPSQGNGFFPRPLPFKFLLKSFLHSLTGPFTFTFLIKILTYESFFFFRFILTVFLTFHPFLTLSSYHSKKTFGPTLVLTFVNVSVPFLGPVKWSPVAFLNKNLIYNLNSQKILTPYILLFVASLVGTLIVD